MMAERKEAKRGECVQRAKMQVEKEVQAVQAECEEGKVRMKRRQCVCAVKRGVQRQREKEKKRGAGSETQHEKKEKKNE